MKYTLPHFNSKTEEMDIDPLYSLTTNNFKTFSQEFLSRKITASTLPLLQESSLFERVNLII